jgi:nucleoside-diphosphate-sugar epimerase
MPDCISSIFALMNAERPSITPGISYNVTATSLSAGELASEIGKYIPGFRCEYKPDYRQDIVDSWPSSLDDSSARVDWGWKPEFGLESMTKDMIAILTKRFSA